MRLRVREDEVAQAERPRWAWAVWLVVAVAALAMRVAQLDGAPLEANEAAAAMRAWQAAGGEALPPRDYEPVLLVGNTLLFALLGASDTVARLWPALFGALLAVSPVLLGRRLGRVAALAAGIYLAVSPTALVASRQLRGTAIAAVGVMGFVGGVARFVETERRGWLTLSAVGLALGLASGPSAYGLLVPLVGAWLLVALMGSDEESSDLAYHVSLVRSQKLHFVLVLTAALFGLSTGLGWNLPGLGAVGGVFGEWLGRFDSGAAPATSPLTLLVVYEPLALVLGVAGLAWGMVREDRGAVVLGLWAALALGLLAITPGRRPTDLVWVVLPLALLAGRGVQEIAADGWLWRRTPSLILGALILVLWAYFYLMLARYARYGDRTDLVLAGIGLVLQGVLAVSFGLVLGGAGTLRTALAATGVALLAATLAAGWGAAYRRPADPREALMSRPTAINVWDLVGTLRELSWQETGMPTALPFTFEAAEDSVLAWYLRDFEMARRVDRIEAMGSGDVVVAQGREAEVLTAGREVAYAGQDFPLWREWNPREIGCRFWERGCEAAVNWFLFRDGVPLPEPGEWVTLWRAGGTADGD